MLDQFIRHIREKNILDFNQHYLLAISGGLDSTVLAHLLHQSGILFSMAHCNFRLRGEESEKDEVFVRQMAKQLGVKVYVKNFETKSHAKMQGVSTQMAARNLRYQWFDELLKEHGAQGFISAHHADDQLETVLLNLLRGTGIEGIYGMSDTRENIIRPLLPFKRADLEEFAAKQHYEWREDQTNASIDYKRNFLRHEVIPKIKESDPAALYLLQFSFDRIKDTGKAFFYFYDTWLESNITHEDGFQYLRTASLEKAPGKKSLLFYWLRSYGFNYFQMEDLIQAIARRDPGKIFFSAEYSLNLDRKHLILGPHEERFEEVGIAKSDIGIQIGQDGYDLLVLDNNIQPSYSRFDAVLDMEKLEFPLKIRQWEQGDRFRPLGMKNFKKVSDLLIDLKTPLIHKRNIKVLCSGEEIVWVIGIRIDDRYKISPSTRLGYWLKKKEN